MAQQCAIQPLYTKATMSEQHILLSRNKLNVFEACQRQFQLRYVNRLSWPTAPIPPKIEAAWQKGSIFHRLLEQHFLDMPTQLPPEADSDVAAWWSTFKQQPPNLPNGERFPEFSLTVPVGDHAIFGRFDLLITNPEQAHIFDWKTERKPRPTAELREDWQTRLYLAMLVEGGSALGHTYSPEQVAITYWFARDPKQSVTIKYDSAEHTKTMAELKAHITQLDRRLESPDGIWPLTENLTTCARCGYRSYCDRNEPAQPINEYEVEAEREEIPEFDTTFAGEPEP